MASLCTRIQPPPPPPWSPEGTNWPHSLSGCILVLRPCLLLDDIAARVRWHFRKRGGEIGFGTAGDAVWESRGGVSEGVVIHLFILEMA